MLKQRVITALIMAPIAIAGVFFLPLYGFAVFVGLIMLVSAWEWAQLAGFSGSSRVIYAGLLGLTLPFVFFVPAVYILISGILWWVIALFFVVGYPAFAEVWSSKISRLMIGILVLLSAFVAMVQLKMYPDNNYLIILLFLLIWGADIGAYFTGKALGKRKLAPSVSPGKSWAGLYGGLATAVIIGLLMVLARPDTVQLVSIKGAIFLGCCALVAVVSVLGDLTLSMFKRNAGVKDSSNLLPGHGGFLDRIDSLLSAAPLFALIVWMVTA
jgi:phosphatidate cytidylyltransferase